MKKSILTFLALAVSVLFSAETFARDQINIVGSSTVYPYGTVNAQRLGESGFKTPTYNPTGTGGGMKLFCAGVGVEHPDITGASRPMKSKEAKLCVENGVTNVVEVMWANDGITFSHSNAAEKMDLTRAEIWTAMAAKVVVDGEVVENPYTKWNEINPSLPAYKIEVLVAPPTSGTRDAFDGNVMEKGCAAMGYEDITGGDDGCTDYREDGRIIEMGENDTLIVQKLVEDKERFGYFGYSYLKDNGDKLQPASLEGVDPSEESIAAYEYPVARPLFIYLKKDHIGVVPGIKEFAQMMVSDEAIGSNGYLTKIGAAPMVSELLSRTRSDVDTLAAFDVVACADKKHPLKDAGYAFSGKLCK